MRRTVPLTRTVPLAPGEPPRRLVPLQRTSGPARVAVPRQRPASGPTRAVRALVLDRDHWTCVPSLDCPPGPRTGLVLHHRLNRGMGGSTDPAVNEPWNLLVACGSCNYVLETATTRDFYTSGWKVRHGAVTPGDIPVLYPPDGTWWLLLPDGQRRPA